MNITKKNKIQTDISPQSKTYLIISTNYQIDNLYNILKKSPSLVNVKDNKNETFLSYAIKRKNIEIAELILTSPILDYSYQDKDGNSYLHLAVINQLENIIRTLIKKGINVNLQNNEGNTALHFAYSTGDIKFITIMIESKVDFTIKNKNGLIAEEVPPGTFPEILDINNNNNQNNNVNITHNKNNTVTINLNVDNSNENNKENDKDNNGVIINERGQINKSIRINWESNNLANNINKYINNNDTLNNNTSNNNNIDNDNNNNVNQLETTAKTKLKYSLVNFSYSDEEDGDGEEDGEEEGKIEKKRKIEGELEGEIPVEGEVEEEEEENGIVSKQDININKNDEKKEKNKIKSSDIFDLASSLSYQEKVANASFINSHTIGEPKILSKQDSNELGTSEDIVNINKIKESQNNPTLSLENDELKNMISNGIDMSQVTFQTAYENGRNMNISQVNYNNGNVRSLDFKNENVGERNGQNVVFDYSTSISKEGGIYDNNEIINKRESEGICNFDNNNNMNQSNAQRPQVEFTQDFTFSPFNTLIEPLNKKVNGSEINIKNSNNINNNSNNLSNINIDKEINSEKKNSSNKNFNIEANSTILKRYDALNENNMQKNNLNISNKTNVSNYKDDNVTLTNIAKSSPTKSNYIRNINTNLSQASQNNINAKTNSKINFNCPVNISEDTVNTSVSKNSHDSLYKFLAEIRMEKYYDIMTSNGFDDINLLISQTKSGLGINDKQLKQAGINLPGDRAKILIKLQEKAGDYIFPIPKEVYYTSQSDNIKNDRNIKKLNDWLKALKVEIYLENFVKNGYHSIELLLMQTESKNTLTDEILRDEIGITKIGHRSRISNKLIEEGKSNINKLKTSMLYLGNNLTEKICDCSIF